MHEVLHVLRYVGLLNIGCMLGVGSAVLGLLLVLHAERTLKKANKLFYAAGLIYLEALEGHERRNKEGFFVDLSGDQPEGLTCDWLGNFPGEGKMPKSPEEQFMRETIRAYRRANGTGNESGKHDA